MAVTVATSVAMTAGTLAFAASSTVKATRPTGTLNVIATATQWPGLDPAVDTQIPTNGCWNAIYGQLFELGPNNQIIDSEASSYKFLDHNTEFRFVIRHGLKFSDGTPMTAAVVAWSINRDLTPAYGNIGDVNFPLNAEGATASGNAVTLHMERPDAAILQAMVDESPNWTVDEVALSSMGEAAYAQHPIGAGPFKVVSNVASAQLDLTANPDYWQYPSKPKVANLNYITVASDSSAIDSLVSGEDQIALGISTIPTIKAAPSQGLTVYKMPAITPEFILFNTFSGPFANIKAREAAAYATNPAILVKALYSNEFSTIQSETGSGQEYYMRNNPYFHQYNLKKAKALVKQLGGLSVNLSTTLNSAFWINEVQAIATMWQQAGIQVNIQDNSLQQMLAITFAGSWQAIDENWGHSVDPAINDPEFFGTTAAFTGNHNAALNAQLVRAEATNNPTIIAAALKEVANIENQQALAIFLYSKNSFNITTKHVNIHEGMSNAQTINWEDIAVS